MTSLVIRTGTVLPSLLLALVSTYIVFKQLAVGEDPSFLFLALGSWGAVIGLLWQRESQSGRVFAVRVALLLPGIIAWLFVAGMSYVSFVVGARSAGALGFLAALGSLVAIYRALMIPESAS